MKHVLAVALPRFPVDDVLSIMEILLRCNRSRMNIDINGIAYVAGSRSVASGHTPDCLHKRYICRSIVSRGMPRCGGPGHLPDICISGGGGIQSKNLVLRGNYVWGVGHTNQGVGPQACTQIKKLTPDVHSNQGVGSGHTPKSRSVSWTYT